MLYALCFVQIVYLRKVYKLLPESQAWLERKRASLNSVKE